MVTGKGKERKRGLVRISFASRRLQGHAILGLALERHAQLQELDKDVPELAEEGLVVLGVALHVLPEFLVLDEGHVGGQHHERFRGDVLVLFGAVPLQRSRQPRLRVRAKKGGTGAGVVSVLDIPS